MRTRRIVWKERRVQGFGIVVSLLLPEKLIGACEMEKLIIDGGRRLTGELKVHGAKNSVLPVLAATLAVGGECVVHNCPMLCDVKAELEILELLGCSVEQENGTVTVDSSLAEGCPVPERLMHEMRSSIIFLGAMLSRFGKAELSIPGGCNIGKRPIDFHLSVFRKMGARCEQNENGSLFCEAPDGLKGANVILPYPSVGATENAMIAACTARGKSVIENAAREPEICDLAAFLNNCGAEIYGAGERTIIIEGGKRLHGSEFSVISDRIVAATLMAACAVTGGKISLDNVNIRHLEPVLPYFIFSGCSVGVRHGGITFKAPGRLKSMGVIRTAPYPGFPTDCQAVFMAMASIANGVTVITERVFENRFLHVEGLKRFGARIETENNAIAVIEGVRRLYGAEACSTDLRGGTALAVAALAARGKSVITGMNHIDRGCERIENCLTALGADAKRVNE